MRVLCIGDVVGEIGSNFLAKKLSTFKKLKNIDVTICNGENSSDGNGILPQTADFLFSIGVDVITLGNHSFTRKEILPYIEDHEYIIRPANFPKGTPGNSYCILDLGYTQLAVINLMGQEFLDIRLDNPYYVIDDVLKEIETKNIIVDFHAEATSEKRAMALYLDGRVSAIFGTHTHCQSGDEEIFESGTGYMTDLGMTGPVDSVLGIRKDIIIERFKTKISSKFMYADGPCKLDGAIFDIDQKTGKTLDIERFEIRE